MTRRWRDQSSTTGRIKSKDSNSGDSGGIQTDAFEKTHGMFVVCQFFIKKIKYEPNHRTIKD